MTKFFEMGNLFSSKSVVVLKRFFQNKSKNLKDDIKNYLNESIDIVFWEDKEVDKRLSLYKFITKKGIYKEFNELNLPTLKRWVKEILSKDGIEIEDRAMEKFFLRTSTDQFIIESELTKIVSYLKATDRDTIKEADIKAMIPITKEESIWDFIDSLAERDKRKSLVLLESLLKGPGDYPLILALLVRQLRILYLINYYKNTPLSELSKKMGMHVFILKKAMQMASSLGLAKIEIAYDKLLGLDVKVKHGEMDPKVGLDLFVLSFL